MAFGFSRAALAAAYTLSVAALGFFAAYAWLRPAAAPSLAATAPSRDVRLTKADVDAVKASITREAGHAPDAAELRRALTDEVRVAVLAREAQALDLPPDARDERRRLAARMSAAMDEAIPVVEPTDADLKRTFEQRRGAFAVAPRVSFTQIFFSRERRGARVNADASAAAARLRGDRRRGRLDAGDPTMLPATLESVDEAALAAQFGDAFAKAVIALPIGSWQGPIESSVGVHLVRVTERVEPTARAMEDVRAQVAARWRDEQRAAAREAAYAAVRRKYDVTVDAALLPYFEPGTVQAAAR